MFSKWNKIPILHRNIFHKCSQSNYKHCYCSWINAKRRVYKPRSFLFKIHQIKRPRRKILFNINFATKERQAKENEWNKTERRLSNKTVPNVKKILKNKTAKRSNSRIKGDGDWDRQRCSKIIKVDDGWKRCLEIGMVMFEREIEKRLLVACIDLVVLLPRAISSNRSHFL